MFKFRKKTNERSESECDESSSNWFSKLKLGLKKTRGQMGSGLSQLFLGKKNIDEDLLEALETQLLLADVGTETTDALLENLTEDVKKNQLQDPQQLLERLQQNLLEILTPVTEPLEITASPMVLLMVGVNGAGKTTSIAKIAHYYKQQGKKVMLAAGDTFRAAAVEQLQVWGEKNNVAVVAQKSGGDSAAVIFDAYQSAITKNVDLLIADTAGRLHTQNNLMQELAKIKRVLQKINPAAPHETMLILDASMGQNALEQAKQFHAAIDINSISVTKLDGTAKGGIVFAIAKQLQLPFRFIGFGETIDDLKPFDAHQFISALFEPTAQE